MMKKHYRKADIINMAQIMMGAHTESATREEGRCMGREARAIITAFIETRA